jgi:hypothetical protein
MDSIERIFYVDWATLDGKYRVHKTVTSFSEQWWTLDSIMEHARIMCDDGLLKQCNLEKERLEKEYEKDSLWVDIPWTLKCTKTEANERLRESDIVYDVDVLSD